MFSDILNTVVYNLTLNNVALAQKITSSHVQVIVFNSTAASSNNFIAENALHSNITHVVFSENSTNPQVVRNEIGNCSIGDVTFLKASSVLGNLISAKVTDSKITNVKVYSDTTF